jgi:hypothetical protein
MSISQVTSFAEAQLFLYIDHGYSEQNSFRKSVVIKDNWYNVSFDLRNLGGDIAAKMKEIRFDPAEEPLAITLTDVRVVSISGDSQDLKVASSNGDIDEDGKYVFRHTDPILIFDSSGVDFSSVDYISFSGIIEMPNSLKRQVAYLTNIFRDYPGNEVSGISDYEKLDN